MTKQEFINRLSDDAARPSENEYQEIEFVYTWHPSISQVGHVGQEQIARLYSEFGMRIIRDMHGTACRAMELNDSLSKAKDEVDRIERELEELAMI